MPVLEGDRVEGETKSGLLKVIRKTPDGKEIKLYVCKFCGKESPNILDFKYHFTRGHKNCCPNLPEDYEKPKEKHKEEEKEKEQTSQPQQQETKAILTKEEPTASSYKPKTPEEEMIEEMAKELRKQLSIAPGVGESSKVEWFVEYFKSNKTLQEDPNSLFLALRKMFPKADDEVIKFIVNSVFEVRKSYDKSLQTAKPLFSTGLGLPQSSFGFISQTQQPLTIETVSLLIQNVLKDMQIQALQNQLNEIKKALEEIKGSNSLSPEVVKKMIESETEKLKLEYEKKILEKELELVKKYSGNWSDDYARIIHDLGSRFLDLVEQWLNNMSKWRKTRLSVVSRILGYQEPTRETSELVVDKELEDAGLIREQ